MSTKKTPNTKRKERNTDNTIKDVYLDNLAEEMKNISDLLETYKYVTFDTEFPGVVFPMTMNTREAYYRQIKTNVDKLKMIQLGLTLSDKDGNYPPNFSTWQFNLKFDLNSEQYSHESISLLISSGINFDLLVNRGIPAEVFGEYIMSSGLVLNDDLHYVSFHGIYDFAYFLRIVTNMPLPDTEVGFFETLNIYFPHYYDIRYLVRYNDQFRVGLMRLSQELGLTRLGAQHQAGSDSLLTAEVFFNLKKEYLSDDSVLDDRNVLFGFGLGIDESDPVYYQSKALYNNPMPLNPSNGYFNYAGVYQQNMLNIQYDVNRNKPFFPMNYGVNMNNYGMYSMEGSQLLPNNGITNEESKKRFNLRGIVED